MGLSFPPQPGAGIVMHARDWIDTPGYEFWLNAGETDLVTVAAATNLVGLSGFGWTATALTVTAGSSADFISSADVDPTRIITDAGSDLLASPRIFGEYSHALQASRFLGYMPTKLTLEMYARFATASANETTSFIGLNGPAVVDAAAAGGGGSIRSGGTASTFFLTSDAGSDAGLAIDTTYHKWRITWGATATTTEWFQDDVSMGTITTEADIWPLSLVMFAGVTNRPELAWLRIYYS